MSLTNILCVCVKIHLFSKTMQLLIGTLKVRLVSTFLNDPPKILLTILHLENFPAYFANLRGALKVFTVLNSYFSP